MNAAEAEAARNKDIQKLAELIKDIRVAMLTTVNQQGQLRSRPMATQNTPFDGNLWFFTDKDSGKVDEMHDEHDVNVAYSDPDAQKYISVSGKATLVTDRQRIEEYWHPALKAWFPKGKDDPQISLIKVRVDQVEYWDSPSGKVVQLAGFIKAIVKGERYQGEGSEHEKLKI